MSPKATQLQISSLLVALIFATGCDKRQPPSNAEQGKDSTATSTTKPHIAKKLLPEKTDNKETWSKLVSECSGLIDRSVYVPVFKKLITIRNQADNPQDIADIAKLSVPLRAPFIAWWEGCERHSKIYVTPETDFEALDRETRAYTDPFERALSQNSTISDIPFLLFLEDFREVRMWSCGASWEIVPKFVQSQMNDDVLGLLAFAIKVESTLSPDARRRLYRVIGQTRDRRALPSLVDACVRNPYARNPDRYLVEAIRSIDPELKTMASCFAYYNSYATGGYVPAETGRVRLLERAMQKRNN